MAEKVSCIVRGDKGKYCDCRCISEIQTEARSYTRVQAHEKVKRYPAPFTSKPVDRRRTRSQLNVRA